jgi:hypothetical protein
VDAAAATTAADGLGADGTNSDKVLQPGSDVVVTFVIYEAGRAGEKVVMQEIQVGLSSRPRTMFICCCCCCIDPEKCLEQQHCLSTTCAVA